MKPCGSVLVDSGQVALISASGLEKWTLRGTGEIISLAMRGRDEELVVERCKEIGITFEEKDQRFIAYVSESVVRDYDELAAKLRADEGLIFVNCLIRDNSFDRLFIKDESPIHPVSREVSSEVSYVVSTRYGDGEFKVYRDHKGYMVLFSSIPLDTNIEVIDELSIQEPVEWSFIDPCYCKDITYRYGTTFKLLPGKYRVEQLKSTKGESIGLRVTQ
ncbi:hypothetical protein ACFPOG_12885 [Paenibacillus aestuarii]|uniref:Uncharacterized protein n=1 Tax=Paenibacillus aestuarii TaxID=516965 RepID=A0ABW0K709_9BACL